MFGGRVQTQRKCGYSVQGVSTLGRCGGNSYKQRDTEVGDSEEENEEFVELRSPGKGPWRGAARGSLAHTPQPEKSLWFLQPDSPTFLATPLTKKSSVFVTLVVCSLK